MSAIESMGSKTSRAGKRGAPAYTISLDKALAVRLSAYGLLLFFLAVGVYGSFTAREASSATSPWYIAIFLGTVVAYELTHGLCFRVFGGKPRYGAGVKYFFPYFYTTAPGNLFTLRQMIVIALAPLFSICAASLVIARLVPALSAYLAIVFIGNMAGAIGDIWTTGRLVRFLPLKDVAVADLADGIAVYTQDAKATEIASTLYARDEQPPVFLKTWLLAGLAVLAAETLAIFIGPLFADELLVGPPRFPLITFATTGRSSEFTVNLAVPFLAGFIFALAIRFFSDRKPQGIGP